ncbi:prepilin-type N-terminal cleavage/methylation domain-containing protein [Deinococcus taklimakanensis]|uniref:Prepilin-type N-terminal cleavage/methylation domain-containing protein n=1 Tax=Deinococcus taklimakanensis TaxID=536443 RepID=A0ABW5P038_9DEIO
MHGQKRGVQPQQGFTLIEILVAIALLGLLAAVLTSTLTGSLSLNRQAQKQLDTTSNVQQVLETVRNAWNTKDNYDKACAPGLSVPSGYTVKFVNLSSRAEPLTSAGAIATTATGATSAPSNDVNRATTCTAATGATVGTPAEPPVMRRVTVQSGTMPASGTTPVVGAQDVSLTLDILEPAE